jgi:hypothetical protein
MRPPTRLSESHGSGLTIFEGSEDESAVRRELAALKQTKVRED